MLWTALVLGFLGSGHCVFMCGPLSLLLPQTGKINTKLLAGRLLFNVGRVCTYAALGLIVGFLSSKSLLFISQKTLSISAGILLLIIILIQFTSPHIQFNSRILSRYKKKVQHLREKEFFRSHLGFGIINGLLPCGLSYAALGAAFLTLNPFSGALYMVIFGLGTVPLLLVAQLGFGRLNKIRFKRFLPVAYGAMAIWLLFRGLSENPELHGSGATEIEHCAPIDK